MLTDTPGVDFSEKRNLGSSTKLLALACALLVTAALLGGYFYLRGRFTQTRASIPASNASAPAASKGPAKVHVLVDDPLLKNRESVIGGSVRNISSETLDSVAVVLELRRRGDGEIEERAVPIEPKSLAPNEEARYELRLIPQEYAGVKLAGVKSGSTMIAHSSAPGRRRPPVVTPSKSVTVQRPVPRGEEFLNTPDNPGRVP